MLLFISSKSEVDACYLVPAFSGLFCPYWREDARGALVGLTSFIGRTHILLAGLRASAYQVDDLLSSVHQMQNNSRSFSASLGGSYFSGSVDRFCSIISAKPKETDSYCMALVPVDSDDALGHPGRITQILVDGGLASSQLAMKSLADITGVTVIRPRNSDLITSIGVGVCTLLALGMDPTDLLSLRDTLDKPGTLATSGYRTSVKVFEPSTTVEQRKNLRAAWKEAVKRSIGWRTNGGLVDLESGKSPDKVIPSFCPVIFNLYFAISNLF
ncbi:unnamed protein product [Protopolystoma xenopodis]|uniref:Carbohydrate kinase FGGY C-terminal domain-containing protein n=1 Tax=Protopolystoma xenopodis TaxID=117903 RepID=A0A3S5FCV1_9PLAT|nr:unnamed protein product [Protopolystoma xenopodis]